jgi:hypothetical protein
VLVSRLQSGYIRIMRTLHKIIAVLIALAFSATGIARAANIGHPCPSLVQHGVALSGGHVSHQHHPDGQEKPDKQSAEKCCSVCVVVAAGILTAPSHDGDLIASPVVYWANSQSLSGRWTLVDPGIPKHLS